MFLDRSSFVKKLRSVISKSGTTVALAADNDLDGLVAACLMDLAMYELFDLEVDTCFRHEVTWEIDWQQMPDNSYYAGIFLDLAYSNTPNYRNVASRIKNAFAIDHHISSETGFPQKVLAFNPCRNGECYLPTAYLAQEVAQELGKSSSPIFDYLTLLGVLGDCGIYFNVTSSKEIKFGYSSELEMLYKKGRSLFPELFEIETHAEFKYPRYRSVLAAIEKEAADMSWNELYIKFVNESESPTGLQGLVEEILSKHPDAFTQIMAELPSEPSETSSSGIWLMKNKTSISNGVLARTIAEMKSHPNVVYKCMKKCYVAARAPPGSQINFIPAFETFGGGHKGACGACIPPRDMGSLLDKVRAL